MRKCASSDGISTEDQEGSSIENNPGMISHKHRVRGFFLMHFCAAAPIEMSAERQGNVFVLGLRKVASMCGVSGCLQSHTPAREQLAVLRDGSLRHMATGVFTELYIDVPNAEQSSTASCRSRPRMIPWYMAHRYLTLVNTTLARMHTHGHKAVERRPLARNAAGSSSKRRSGSMIGRTCQPSALSPQLLYI